MSNSRECPECGSSDVGSNKFGHKGDGGHTLHALSHSAKHHPIATAVLGAAYLIGKGIDQITPAYCCRSCGHKFS